MGQQRYAQTRRSKWRESWYRNASPEAKLVWDALTESGLGTNLPELVEADAFAIAGMVNTLPLERVQAALAEWEGAGRLLIDHDHALILLREEVDEEDQVASAATIQGWHRTYEQIVDAPLKEALIPRLKARVDFAGRGKDAAAAARNRAEIEKAWAETFGRSAAAPSSAAAPAKAPLEAPPTPPPQEPPGEPVTGAGGAQRTASSKQHAAAAEEEVAAPGTTAAPAQPVLRLVREEQPREPKKPKNKPDPLPFTVGEGVVALGAGGGVVVDPFPGNLASRLHKVFSDIKGLTPGDLRRVSEWLANGGDGYGIGYRGQKATLSTLATGSTLAGWVGNARSWPGGPVGDAARRNGSTNGSTARDPKRGRAPVADWTGVQSGEVKL